MPYYREENRFREYYAEEDRKALERMLAERDRNILRLNDSLCIANATEAERKKEITGLKKTNRLLIAALVTCVATWSYTSTSGKKRTDRDTDEVVSTAPAPIYPYPRTSAMDRPRTPPPTKTPLLQQREAVRRSDADTLIEPSMRADDRRGNGQYSSEYILLDLSRSALRPTPQK